LEDRRNVGERSCNFGDGTDQRVQSLKFMMIIIFVVVVVVGRNSVVCIATCYSLDNPGIEFRRGLDFLHFSGPVLSPTHHPVQWVSGLFPRVKRPEPDVGHQPPSSTKVKELYLYSPT